MILLMFDVLKIVHLLQSFILPLEKDRLEDETIIFSLVGFNLKAATPLNYNNLYCYKNRRRLITDRI